MKINIGCGKSSLEDFDGIDVVDYGQRYVCDVRSGFPFDDNSVENAFSSHFLEHLTGEERIGFFNDLYRVMKHGAKAKIITPDFCHASAYGDPTHQWPPCSNWYPMYLNEMWRKQFAPHVPYTCDFEYSSEITNQYLKGFSLVELVVTLTAYKK